jgi:ATP-binding protein involved in chromosome partitioning
LGEIPLELATRVGGDEGKPIVTSDPESPVTQAFKGITNTLIERVDAREEDQGLLKRVFKIN